MTDIFKSRAEAAKWLLSDLGIACTMSQATEFIKRLDDHIEMESEYSGIYESTYSDKSEIDSLKAEISKLKDEKRFILAHADISKRFIDCDGYIIFKDSRKIIEK